MDGAEPEREALPGSPFSLHCLAGKAHAAGSSVDRFSRADTEDKATGAARLAAARAISAKPLTEQAEAHLKRHEVRGLGIPTCEPSQSLRLTGSDTFESRPDRRGLRAKARSTTS